MSDETASQSRIKITWLLGTLGIFALFAVIASYSSRMTSDYPDYDQQRAKDRKVTLEKVRKAENALLYPAVDAQGRPSAEWVDQAKGTIRIPIEEAMAKEIDTLKGQAAAAGAEIPGTVPPAPATPAPAAGATNAAPAKPSAPAAKSPATKGAPAKPAAPTAKAPSTNAAPAVATPPPANPNPSNK